MKIQKYDGYFETYPLSATVSKITCPYVGGLCSVHYLDGTVHSLNTVADGYNSQFGLPVSPDGKLLFVSSWDTGLHAYDIITGKEIWHFKSTRIKAVYTAETYVVAVRYGNSILKLNIADGSKIGELRSGTIECSFELSFPYVLIDTYRGKLSVIDMNTLTVARQYARTQINPINAISFMIREVSLKRNKLTISGLEGSLPFCRVIDHHFPPTD